MSLPVWVLGIKPGSFASALISEPSLQLVLLIFVYDDGVLGLAASEAKIKFFQTAGFMGFYNILHKWRKNRHTKEALELKWTQLGMSGLLTKITLSFQGTCLHCCNRNSIGQGDLCLPCVPSANSVPGKQQVPLCMCVWEREKWGGRETERDTHRELIKF